jgi:uncharacterized protein YgfB (UPF0149 family)
MLGSFPCKGAGDKLPMADDDSIEKVVSDMGQVCQINANSMAKIADQSNSLKKIRESVALITLFCDLYDGE